MLQAIKFRALLPSLNRTITLCSCLILSLVTSVAQESRLGNLSTRAQVGTGDEVLIGGLVIEGSQPKTVVIRALGPSLSESGVSEVLFDPNIKLLGSSGLLDQNEDWRDHLNAELIPLSLHPKSEVEAAIYTTLSPGAYTAIVRGGGGTGIALIEVYEINEDASTRLINISTRGIVGVGDDVMIGGVIIQGDEPKTVAIRALGLTLSESGVPGVLEDPTVRLLSANGPIDENDNWRDHPFSAFIPENLASKFDNESVILRTLDPGAYTAIVRGKNGARGIALVEVYDIEVPLKGQIVGSSDVTFTTPRGGSIGDLNVEIQGEGLGIRRTPFESLSGASGGCAIHDYGLRCWRPGSTNSTPFGLNNATFVSEHGSDGCVLINRSINCWGPITDDYDVPSNLTNPTAVSVGFLNICAIGDAGVSCWGEDIFGNTMPPADLSNPTEVGVGGFHTCAITTTGVRCWGGGGNGQEVVPPGLVNPTSLAVGLTHSCVIAGGAVRCWGESRFHQLDVPAGLINPRQVVSNRHRSCALADNGVFCWGIGWQGGPPFNLVNPRLISTSEEDSCALDDEGLKCWGPNISNGSTIVPDNLTFSQGESFTTRFDFNASNLSGFSVTSGDKTLQGVIRFDRSERNFAPVVESLSIDINEDQVANIRIPANDGNGDTLSFEATNLPKHGQLEVKGDRFIYTPEANFFGFDTFRFRATDGDLSSNEASVSITIASVVDPIALKAERQSVSVLKNSYSAIGLLAAGANEESLEVLIDEAPQHGRLVFAGDVDIDRFFGCAIDDDGVACWGDNSFGQTDVPTGITQPLDLDVGNAHACLIESSQIQCWGRSTEGQIDVPNNIQRPARISLGVSHSCAIADDDVVCWGGNEQGQTEVPPGLVNPFEISAGGRHSCALDDNGVHCWGDNNKSQLQVPDGISNPTRLSVGFEHSCVIADSGVVCWGDNSFQQITVPFGLQELGEISTGTAHSCVIHRFGIRCWGSNTFGQRFVPGEIRQAQQLSGGGYANCAIHSGGLDCWGGSPSGSNVIDNLRYQTANFRYIPDPGFVGQDTFTYHISNSESTVTGVVEIMVEAP